MDGDHQCRSLTMTELILIVLYLLPSLSVSARNVHPYLVLENQSEIASPHQFPWLVSIQKPRILGLWQHNCGGSLIAVRDGQTESDIVVSAAHCFQECYQYCKEKGTVEDSSACMLRSALMGKSIGRDRIAVGEHVLNDAVAEERQFSLASLRCHNFLAGGRFVNDIALVKLSSPVKFTENIRPIRLPAQDLAAEYSGCQVAGWGVIGYKKFTKELRYANNTIYEDEMCSALSEEENAYDPDLMLCAGKTRSSSLGDIHQVACGGDSGGPLMCENENGGITLVGVVSHGANSSCEPPGTPDVYTKVAPYVEWIVDNADEITSVESG